MKGELTLGSKVLIYGGSGAVGSAIARDLKEKGYDLHLVGQTKKSLKRFQRNWTPR